MATSSGDASPRQQDSKPSTMRYTWMFAPDKSPTKQLDALLRAIGKYITQEIGDKHETQLTPEKLAAFYKSVGGNYDSLFVSRDHQAISYIWQITGCQHSLVQPTRDDYACPTIPALTPRGFSRWESLEILLDPEEHVPFLQHAVKNWNLKHTETGEPFPPDLPNDVFPSQPDADVDRWHEDCAHKLWKEASNEELPRKGKPEPSPEPAAPPKFSYAHVQRPSHHQHSASQNSQSYYGRRPFSYVQAPQRQGPQSGPSGGGARSPDRPRRDLSPDQQENARRRSFSDYASSTTQDHPPPPHSQTHLDPNARRPQHTRRHSHPRQYSSSDEDDAEPVDHPPRRRPQPSPPSSHNRRYPGAQPQPSPSSTRPNRSEPRVEELKRRNGNSPLGSLRDKVSEKVSNIFPGTGSTRVTDRRQATDSRPGSYDGPRSRRSPQQRVPSSRHSRGYSNDDSDGISASESEDDVRRRPRGPERGGRYSDRERPYELDQELDDDVDSNSRRNRQYLRRPETQRRTSSHADVDRRRETPGFDPRDRDRGRLREDRRRYDNRVHDDRDSRSPVTGGGQGRRYAEAAY